MRTKPKQVEPIVTTVRSSYSLPSWIDRQIADIAARTFSTKSQVARRLLAKALESERAEAAAS